MVFAADSESCCIIYLFIVAFVVLYSRICKIMKRVKPDSDRIEVLTEEEKIDSSTSCEKNSAYAMTRARRTKAITTEIQRGVGSLL